MHFSKLPNEMTAVYDAYSVADLFDGQEGGSQKQFSTLHS